MNNKKIAVLTLNPGIDRIVYLDAPMIPGGHNRSARAVVNQGSKGANQSILLKNLGAEPEYFAFTGGTYGALAESFTENAGVNGHFTETACGVRLNIKVIEPDGRGTEFNERGGPVSTDELSALTERLLNCDCDIVSLCGSFPQGVEKTVYNSLITEVKRRGKTVLLDTSGEALLLGAAAKPYLIKPNRAELAAFGYGVPETWKTASEICGKIYESYGCRVLCTLDADGSVYVGDEGRFRITAPPQKQMGFSGAGDAYLAAFMYAYLAGNAGIAEALRFGAAASVAKIRLEGTVMPDAGQINAVLTEIKVEKI